MIEQAFFTAAALLCLSAGCGESGGTEAPQAEKTALVLSLKQVAETSVTVDAELSNADVAYCRIGAATAAVPSLSELRKGRELTASGPVIFDGLEAGTSYKVYGVAGLQGVYANIEQLPVKTAGVLDEHYPASIAAWCTTADKRSLFAEVSPAPVSSAAAQAKEIAIDRATRYQTMEGFGSAITDRRPTTS